MGIKGFISWITINHPDCIIKNIQSQCLLIDINFMLHYHSARLVTFNELLENIQTHIYHLLNKINPEMLILVMDGIPPDAKYNVVKYRKEQLSKKQIDPKYVNPLHLSNDIELINNIKLGFQQYSKNMKKLIGINIITLFDEKDEGELKISNFINSSELSSFCIVSNDSDTILLSLLHQKNICVVNLKPKQNKIISIDKLITSLNLYFNHPTNLINDFILISILIGNDYVPKLKFVTEILIFSTYKKFASFSEKIYEKSVIYIKPLIHFFELLLSKMKFNKKISIDEINFKDIKHYLNTILWCLMCYEQSTCINEHLNFNLKPQHPFNVLLYCYSLTSDTITI
jgi:5'-3' exonuclease